MSGIRDIKERMKGVKNIQQITKAMKMVAAARIKKAEERIKLFRPYNEEIKANVRNVLSEMNVLHPLFREREAKKVLILVITADRGLCGAYNHNIIRQANTFILSLSPEKEYQLITIGNKGKQFFQKRGYPLKETFSLGDYSEQEARKLSQMFISSFLKNDYDQILCIYSRFISATTQRVTCEKILPLSLQPLGLEFKSIDEYEYGEIQNRKGYTEYIFEPSVKEITDKILPQYLTACIYNILFEAKASEIGARLVAMSNATDNAQKLLDELTLLYYRARQEAITTEILEVSTGAEALKG